MTNKSTLIALVAALAVTAGGLGLSLTGVFDDDGVQIATKENITGNSLNTRRMFKATVSDETYTFDIDIEKSA